MSLLVQLAMRNVRRNTRRSILTALMITAGTALLILGMSSQSPSRISDRWDISTTWRVNPRA